MKYILVAYKPDSSDYCRGCHMASYSSGYKMYSECTREQLIKEWAALRAIELSCNEAEYEFQLIIDGYFVGGERHPYRGSIDIGEEEDENIVQPLRDEYDRLLVEVRERNNQIIHDRNKEKDEKILQQTKKRQEEERAADLRKLEMLKAKYPNNY